MFFKLKTAASLGKYDGEPSTKNHLYWALKTHRSKATTVIHMDHTTSDLAGPAANQRSVTQYSTCRLTKPSQANTPFLSFTHQKKVNYQGNSLRFIHV